MGESAQLEIPDPPNDAKITTGDVMERLAAQYARDEYVVLFDIGDAVGTKYRRRADAIVIGCWQSTGRHIEGFEIKVSRGDWLREVKAVEKADPFLNLVDKWWLVCPDGVAKAEEVPACWGWKTLTKHGFRVQRPATLLPNADRDINRLFALELLRKSFRCQLDAPEVRAALKAASEIKEATITQRVSSEVSQQRHDGERLRERVEKFEKTSGLKLDDWRLGDVGKDAKAIAKLHDEGYGSAASRLEQHERVLETLLEDTREARAALAVAAGVKS